MMDCSLTPKSENPSSKPSEKEQGNISESQNKSKSKTQIPQKKAKDDELTTCTVSDNLLTTKTKLVKSEDKHIYPEENCKTKQMEDNDAKMYVMECNTEKIFVHKDASKMCVDENVGKMHADENIEKSCIDDIDEKTIKNSVCEDVNISANEDVYKTCADNAGDKTYADKNVNEMCVDKVIDKTCIDKSIDKTYVDKVGKKMENRSSVDDKTCADETVKNMCVNEVSAQHYFSHQANNDSIIPLSTIIEIVKDEIFIDTYIKNEDDKSSEYYVKMTNREISLETDEEETYAYQDEEQISVHEEANTSVDENSEEDCVVNNNGSKISGNHGNEQTSVQNDVQLIALNKPQKHKNESYEPSSKKIKISEHGQKEIIIESNDNLAHKKIGGKMESVLGTDNNNETVKTSNINIIKSALKHNKNYVKKKVTFEETSINENIKKPSVHKNVDQTTYKTDKLRKREENNPAWESMSKKVRSSENTPKQNVADVENDHVYELKQKINQDLNTDPKKKLTNKDGLQLESEDPAELVNEEAVESADEGTEKLSVEDSEESVDEDSEESVDEDSEEFVDEDSEEFTDDYVESVDVEKAREINSDEVREINSDEVREINSDEAGEFKNDETEESESEAEESEGEAEVSKNDESTQLDTETDNLTKEDEDSTEFVDTDSMSCDDKDSVYFEDEGATEFNGENATKFKFFKDASTSKPVSKKSPRKRRKKKHMEELPKLDCSGHEAIGSGVLARNITQYAKCLAKSHYKTITKTSYKILSDVCSHHLSLIVKNAFNFTIRCRREMLTTGDFEHGLKYYGFDKLCDVPSVKIDENLKQTVSLHNIFQAE